MAVTVTTSEHRPVKFVGGKRAILCKLTLTGTYVSATGVPATALTPGKFGLSRIQNLIFLDKISSGGVIPQWTRSTGLLSLYGASAVSTPFTTSGLNGDTITGSLRVMAIGV